MSDARRRIWITAAILVVAALVAVGLVCNARDNVSETREKVEDTAAQADANTERGKANTQRSRAAKRRAERADRRSARTLSYLRGEQGIPGVPGRNGLGTPGPSGGEGPAGESVEGPEGPPGATVVGPAGAQGPPPSPEQISAAVADWFATHQAELGALIDGSVADYFDGHAFICEPTAEVDDPPERQRCSVEP